MNKKLLDIVALILVVFVIALAVSVGLAYAMDLPLPIINDKSLGSKGVSQDALMNKWNNVKIYQAPDRDATVQDIIKDATKASNNEADDINSSNFYSKFSEIDQGSLDAYLKQNPDALTNGYDKLLIDKADVNNTATGIKTKQGDNILAIDAYDNILIIGTNVDGQNAKVAILKNKQQLGFSVVEDLAYWNQIAGHASAESAIFAVNASGYNWNQAGNYGILYGLAKRNGTVIRKYQLTNQVIGFTQAGDLKVGDSADIDSLYNACEFSPILIQDGNVVYTDTSDGTRMARTAIGQTSDGSVIFITVDGDDSNGATLADMVSVMQKFGAVNAANLSGENKSVMWWNGRIINNCYDCSNGGLKLPDAWVIKSMGNIANK